MSGELTRETPAEGLVVWQPRRGFRYGAEAFWLVGFALEAGVPERAVDLGTGSGIMAMLLAGRGVPTVGLDVREEWGACWRRSLDESRALPVELRQGDVSEPGVVRALGAAELVLSNPPFFPVGTGPVAPDPWKAAARTESTADLVDFLGAAESISGSGGRVCVVVPRERADEVCRARPGLMPRRRVDVGVRRSLVELGREAAEVRIEEVLEGSERVGRWYAMAGGGVNGGR